MRDWMPSFGRGSHSAESGQACVMEYVSVVMGLGWSDWPTCTNPVLSGVAQYINDNILDDDERAATMMPFVVRLAQANDSSAVEQRRLLHQLEVLIQGRCTDQCAPVEEDVTRLSNWQFYGYRANTLVSQECCPAWQNRTHGCDTECDMCRALRAKMVGWLDALLTGYEQHHPESEPICETNLRSAWTTIEERV